LIEYLINLLGNFENIELASSVAAALVQHAIEEVRSAGKTVAKLCALLIDTSCGNEFHNGLVTAAWQYFECRDQLRIDHFRYWIAFLGFISDLYASIGFTYEGINLTVVIVYFLILGELVDILFRVFEYMLRAPVLETLKIEEACYYL